MKRSVGEKKTFWSLYKLTIYLLWSSTRLVPVLHSHKAPSQAQRRPEMQARLQTDSRCRSWRKGCHSSLHLTNLGSSPHYQHWINKQNHIISGLLALLEQNSNKRSKDGKTKQRRAQSTDPWTVLWFALKTNRNILCYRHADVSGISPHKATCFDEATRSSECAQCCGKPTRPNNMTTCTKATEKLSRSQTKQSWKRMTEVSRLATRGSHLNTREEVNKQ